MAIYLLVSPVKSDEPFGSFSLPSYLYKEPEIEPEIITIDNLYITNRLYGTEVIVDPYTNDESDYEDEDEEW